MANRIQINRLTNANMYLKGKSLLGKVESATMPEIKFKKSEHKALGMTGTPKYPTGSIEPMEMKVKMNAWYPDVLKLAGNPYEAQQLQLRGNLETYEGGTRISEKPAIVYVTAQFANLPLGSFTMADNVEQELTLDVTACKVEVDGEEIIDIDIETATHIVNGVDLLAAYKANLGI